MGKKSRTKGRAFEQKIARKLRAIWPAATVRRSSQAERAYQSDVFIEGGPPLLSQLWLELNDARNPNVRAKLDQAEEDVAAIGDIAGLPVVIWHRLGQRSIQASMRLWTLAALAYDKTDHSPEIVTMDLGSFLRLVEGAIARAS